MFEKSSIDRCGRFRNWKPYGSAFGGDRDHFILEDLTPIAKSQASHYGGESLSGRKERFEVKSPRGATPRERTSHFHSALPARGFRLTLDTEENYPSQDWEISNRYDCRNFEVIIERFASRLSRSPSSIRVVLYEPSSVANWEIFLRRIRKISK